MAPAEFPAWVKSPAQTLAHHGVADVTAGLSAAQVAKQRAAHGYNELDKEPGKPLWRLVLEQFDDTLVKVRRHGTGEPLPGEAGNASARDVPRLAAVAPLPRGAAPAADGRPAPGRPPAALTQILLLAAVVSFVLAYIEEKPEGEADSFTHYVEPLVIVLILVLNAIVGVWQESNAENALEALKSMQSDTAKVWRDGRMVSDLPSRELVPGDIVELRVGDRIPADMRVLRLKTATLRVEQASLTGESVAVGK